MSRKTQTEQEEKAWDHSGQETPVGIITRIQQRIPLKMEINNGNFKTPPNIFVTYILPSLHPPYIYIALLAKINEIGGK